MDLQPTLEDELVAIRPLHPLDLEPLYGVAKDPKIWEQHPCKRYLRDEFNTFFKESMNSKGALTIIDRKKGILIGSSRFKEIEGFANGVEIGWTFLSRDYWGGRYNSAVKNLMIAHAFTYVDNVLFYVAKDNIRSQRAVEKIKGEKIRPSEYKKVPRVSADTLTFIIKK